MCNDYAKLDEFLVFSRKMPTFRLYDMLIGNTLQTARSIAHTRALERNTSIHRDCTAGCFQVPREMESFVNNVPASPIAGQNRGARGATRARRGVVTMRYRDPGEMGGRLTSDKG